MYRIGAAIYNTETQIVEVLQVSLAESLEEFLLERREEGRYSQLVFTKRTPDKILVK